METFPLRQPGGVLETALVIVELGVGMQGLSAMLNQEYKGVHVHNTLPGGAVPDSVHVTKVLKPAQ